MVMEQCYSGGFIDNFIDQYSGTQKRVIATAATGSEPSWERLLERMDQRGGTD